MTTGWSIIHTTLDPKYDDEYGNPYDYGMDDENEDEDDWRRK